MGPSISCVEGPLPFSGPALPRAVLPRAALPVVRLPGAAPGGPADADLNSLADLQPDPADGLAARRCSCLRGAGDVPPDQRTYFRPGRAGAYGAADLGLTGRPPYGLAEPVPAGRAGLRPAPGSFLPDRSLACGPAGKAGTSTDPARICGLPVENPGLQGDNFS